MKKLLIVLAVIAFCIQAPAIDKIANNDKYEELINKATDKALEFLAKQQSPNGSFPNQRGPNTGIASLCVMAFLAKGYQSDLEPYGKIINKSIDFVLSQQQPSGLISNGDRDSMYCHNISTLMLSEVSGMVNPERQKKIDTALAKAIKLIIDAQKVQKADVHKGGWCYFVNSQDSDLSQSGWALMALRSARNNGAPVPKEAIDDAIAFIEKKQNADGTFSYSPTYPDGLCSYFAKTGTALLCLELCGKHRNERCIKAQQYLQKKLDSYGNKPWAGVEKELFYYGMYYVAQGMYQYGGEEWEKFSPTLFNIILGAQSEDGSWDQKTVQQDREVENWAGSCYKTAMAVLALSVSYRQLPIYQR